MADTGKQSPLGVNLNSSILQDIGFRINPVAEEHMGISRSNTQYSFGTVVSKTCLRLLTWAINDGYNRGQPAGGNTLTNNTYDNLISIGIYPKYLNPFLGNSKPRTYEKKDPSNMWCGPDGETGSIVGGLGQATTGFAISGVTGQGQSATWIPYNTSNLNRSVTQWGYIRLHALQAWYEFNWNGVITGSLATGNPQYKEFCASFMQCDGFVSYSNQVIFATSASRSFLLGAYSNMPDLMTADIAGICNAFKEFGSDLMALGKSLSLADLSTFGKPSNLLKTIYQNNAVTQELTLALLGAGLSEVEIDQIGFGLQPDITPIQEKQIYGAFLVIAGENLKQILIPLNCSTANLTSLADLLNVRKMFPTSFKGLTVPIYSTTGLRNPSKTYYFIFSGEGVNSQLTSSAISLQVGNLSPPGLPQTTDATSQSSTTEVNIQDEPIGFGSNLINILPTDLAVAASALSYSMLQVSNITKTDIQTFAQIVYSLETNFGLGLTNGTDGLPVNFPLANTGLNITGLGSGPYGSYTMSDFFGCMSGLPYAWSEVLYRIGEVQTKKLINIYNQLFLAVTWEPAKFTITQPNGYIITKPYVPPTIQQNLPNPAFNTDSSTVTAGSFRIGVQYQIVSIGTTNFTLIGASSNTVGVQFVATGAGTGTGTAFGIVNTNVYINPSTGAQTNAPTRYVTAGSAEEYSWWYKIEIIYNNDDGGGYYRGTADNPIVTISPNNVEANVSVIIGTNDLDAGSVGLGTFGRIKDKTINNGRRYTWKAKDIQSNWNNSVLVGQNVDTAPAPTTPIYPPRDQAWVDANMPNETISIQHPPTATLSVLANGDISLAGRNTPGDVYDRNGLVSTGTQGWPNPMNAVVQGYIDQANQEIEVIMNGSKRVSAGFLNALASQFGLQLTREQRARFIALPPVPIPRDPWINIYPTTLYVFTDNLPTYAQNTLPHMQAQTLEAISNTSTTGGQSIIGSMRTERNQVRLATAGISLDNNIPSNLNGISQANTTALILNGTAPVALPTNGITNITTNENFTLPAWVTNYDAAGNLIYPKSSFVYSTNTGVTIATGGFVGGSTINLLSGNSNISIVGTAVPTGPYTTPVNTFTLTPNEVLPNEASTNANLLRCEVDTGPNTNNSNLVVLTLKSGRRLYLSLDNINNVVQVVSAAIAKSETGNEEIHVCEIILSNIQNPSTTTPIGGTFISTTSIAPGSFAYANPVLPINLDATYISGALLPSTPNINEAIATVIECNCDCWIT